MKGTYKWVQQSLSVSAEIPTVFQNVDSDINYEVKGFAPAPQGAGWALNLLVPSVTFRASSFSMNGFVEREVGGTKVRVNVNATCTGLVVTSQKPFSVSMNGEFKNAPFGMKVSSVVWSEDPSQWNLTAQNCTGPVGFTTFINQQINSYWKDSPSFKQSFLAELNSQLLEYVSQRASMNETFPDLASKLTLKPVEFLEKGANWVFKLDSQIVTEKKCIFAETGTIADASIPLSTSATLVVPDGVVLKWSQCMHEMAQFKRTDDSSKTAFQTSLLESPLGQSAVWPDLARYPTTTKFDIVTSSLGNWSMVPGSDPNLANYRVDTGILTKFVLNRYGDKTPYVTFWGTFSSTLNLSKVGENVVLKISGTPTASFKYRFDMVNSAITDKKIDVARLRDEMMTALKAESMTFKIPKYEFSQAGTFQATSMSRSGGALLFGIDFTR